MNGNNITAIVDTLAALPLDEALHHLSDLRLTASDKAQITSLLMKARGANH